MYILAKSRLGTYFYRNHAEKIVLPTQAVALVIEGILFFSGYLRRIRGTFYIFTNLMITGEFTQNSEYFFGLPIESILTIIISLYVAITYNQKFLPSIIAYFIGIVYMEVKLTLNPYKNLMESLLLHFVCIGILLAVGLLMYFYENLLRKNFLLQLHLSKKKKFLKKVLEKLPTSIILLKNHKMHYINLSMTNLLVITENEFKEISELDKEKRHKELSLHLHKIKLENEEASLVDIIYSLENQNEDHLSKKFFILFEGRRIDFQVRTVNFSFVSKNYQILVFEDVSQVQRISAEIETKYKHILVASTSHEIINPINGSLALIEEIIPQILDRKLKKNLEIINNSCLKLIYYVNLIKDFSKIDNNNIELHLSNFNLFEVINECLKIVGRDIKMKKLQIHKNF